MNKDDLNLYDELYKANWSTLFGMARNILHSIPLAEELTQKAFMVCFCKFERVKTHPHPDRWLKKVMRNLIGNELKKIQIQKEHSSNLIVDQFATTEQTEKLDDVLPLELSKEDRQLLIWAYEDCLSHSEIAEKLGISENACRTRLFRARERYREIIRKNIL